MPDSDYAMARERWKRCQAISDEARAKGLDVTPLKVNRHYLWFTRWYEGRLSTGYLMRRTGIQPIKTDRST